MNWRSRLGDVGDRRPCLPARAVDVHLKRISRTRHQRLLSRRSARLGEPPSGGPRARIPPSQAAHRDVAAGSIQ
jgi:hypothetical protein